MLSQVWSKAAALRALRATLVVPGLFALCYYVIRDAQMATFAAFGGFATLVMASFGGGRREKAVAHLGLAVVGSVLLTIGTLVSFSPWLAAVVSLPVAFAVLFAGIIGPNAASGGLAALIAYVLPAASPGAAAMLPSRLAGWWMAAVVGTAAVMLLSPRPAGDRLRAAAADLAHALSEQLDAALRGELVPGHRAASIDAKHAMLRSFTDTPYRPTGLATADRALENLVAMLEWATAVVCDSLHEYGDLSRCAAAEGDLMRATATTLHDIGRVLRGEPHQPDLSVLEGRLAESVAHLDRLDLDDEDYPAAVHLAFHSRTVAVTTRAAAGDALVAARRADPAVVQARRRGWLGIAADDAAERGLLREIFGRHANLRSVWLLNSLRGAAALAVAVGIADATGVAHGFWVVLGALSVLRTSAAATGSTALRALLGTALGFAIGAGLVLLIGTAPAALWIALPVAVLFAGYSPGTLPFTVGQAAFTVTISVLYNIIAPVGWMIGVVRIEDVAIGCAVSLVVGALLWPRGAGGIVGDDLADAFHEGAAYLSHAVSWALGTRHDPPSAAAALAAGTRLDDALRGFLAEQGAKRVPADDLWRLVGGTVRLRLTAFSLAALRNAAVEPDSRALEKETDGLVGWYDRLATQLSRPGANRHDTVEPLPPPDVPDATVPRAACALWVQQHLSHLGPHLSELTTPAATVATQRRRPWWR